MPASSEKDYLTIGEVVSRLCGEFPDLSISKVRYLEEEGLIKPRRTKGGYRKFSEEDVKRLELVLRFQRDKFLPLNVIRENLEATAEGEVSLPEMGVPEEVVPSPEEAEPLDVVEVVRTFGFTPEQIRSLEEFGIVKPRQSEGGKVFDPIDLEILKLTRELQKFGLEPRHLRMYENFVDRETSFFQQILLPLLKQRGPDGIKRAKQLLSELTKLGERLKHLLLQRSLEEKFPDF